MELNSDMILYGAGGAGAGYAIGWILKKTIKVLFKIAMVIAVLFVTALVYLQSIRVIEINEEALDTLINEGYNQINNTIGTSDAVTNPMMYVVTNLGLPMSSGLSVGLIAGWLKG